MIAAKREKRPAVVQMRLRQLSIEIISVVSVIVIYGIPFYYVLVNSAKSPRDAAGMTIHWPETFYMVQNYIAVLQTNNHVVIRAFWNSTKTTFAGVLLIVILSALTGFILNRRQGRTVNILSYVLLAGLMIPPAIVPTIWILNGFGLFRTLTGLVLVQVALGLPFATILFRAFLSTIPKELDEAAMIDGCGPIRLFFTIILPLLKPVISTVVILTSVTLFNDFMNPLFLLPGTGNVTVQLTMFHFMSQFATDWNLLFANVVLITLPLLILFIIFNKKIVAGMTAGAMKG